MSETRGAVTASTATSKRWGGNLPCYHGPDDGCAAHNPDNLPHFFAQLPSSCKPASANILNFKSLFERATGKQKPNADAAPNPSLLLPPITSSLSQTPQTCTPLPRVHPSVPYSLAPYHVHEATSATLGSNVLQLLTCHGTTPSRAVLFYPALTWSITPLVCLSPFPSPPTAVTTNDPNQTQQKTFLVRYTLTFPISLPEKGWNGNPPQDLSYSKNWLASPFYRGFSPCPHCTRVFHSVRLKSSCDSSSPRKERKHVRTVRIDYALKNVLGQEIKGVWKSEEAESQTPGQGNNNNMSCGMCYTDFGMEFVEGLREVTVRMWVWKDLGLGWVGDGGEGDVKWEAARGGRTLRRDRADFGRIRRAFEGSGMGRTAGGIRGGTNYVSDGTCTDGADHGEGGAETKPPAPGPGLGPQPSPTSPLPGPPPPGPPPPYTP